MPQTPDKPKPTPQPERLRHSPNEMIIGLSVSPQGRPCIGMTFAGQEWTLLTTRTALIADKMRQQLQTDFDTETIPGAPFDVRESLATGKLKLHDDIPGQGNKPVGVFVPAGRFDELAGKFNL